MEIQPSNKKVWYYQGWLIARTGAKISSFGDLVNDSSFAYYYEADRANLISYRVRRKIEQWHSIKRQCQQMGFVARSLLGYWNSSEKLKRGVNLYSFGFLPLGEHISCNLCIWSLKFGVMQLLHSPCLVLSLYVSYRCCHDADGKSDRYIYIYIA